MEFKCIFKETPFGVNLLNLLKLNCVLIPQEEGAQSLSSYGADLEALDANPFVLAIGGKARKQELEPVVKDSEDVFTVKSFEGLPLILGRLAFYIAQRTLDNTGI